MTQVDIKPPTFVIFINNIELMHYSYERYLENQLRKTFGFEGTPIKFILKKERRMVFMVILKLILGAVVDIYWGV